MKRLLLTLAAISAVVASLLSPVTATAAPAARSATVVTPGGTPPGDPCCEHSVAYELSWSTGRTLGPAVATNFGRATITGFTKDGSGKYHRALAMKQYPNTTIGQTGSQQPGVVSPDSWYNPATWNWSHIIGSIWDTIWNNCVNGAVTGVVGQAGAALIVNLLVRGASIYLGPYGYAALAISGCIVEMIN